MITHALPDIKRFVDPLVGMSYATFQSQHGGTGADGCWHLVRYLLHAGFGLDLDRDPGLACRQIAEVWGVGDPRDPLTLVQPWDGVILATRHLWSDHVGLVVDPLSFVHVRPRTGVVLEPLRRWVPKLLQLARLRIVG